MALSDSGKILKDSFLLRGERSQHSLHKWLVAIRISTSIRLPPMGGGAPKGALYLILSQTLPQGPFLAKISLKDYDALARRLLNTTFAI